MGSECFLGQKFTSPGQKLPGGSPEATIEDWTLKICIVVKILTFKVLFKYHKSPKVGMRVSDPYEILEVLDY